MSHYETLGVARDADAAALSKAFKRKAAHAHPDRPGGSQEIMAAVNRAFETLSDPNRRISYDQMGLDKPPDIEVQARDWCANKMAQIIADPNFPDHADLIAFTKMHLAQDRGNVKANLAAIHGALRRYDMRLTRLKKKNGGIDHVRIRLEQQRDKQRWEAGKGEMALQVFAAAERILGEYA